MPFHKEVTSLLFIKKGTTYQIIADLETHEFFLKLIVPKNKEYINWLFCWSLANTCKQNLKRPHLTCIRCLFRRFANGDLPDLIPIMIHQIWHRKDNGKTLNYLFKNSLSLTEALS